MDGILDRQVQPVGASINETSSGVSITALGRHLNKASDLVLRLDDYRMTNRASMNEAELNSADRALDLATDRRSAIEDLIATTPARSAEDVAIQLMLANCHLATMGTLETGCDELVTAARRLVQSALHAVLAVAEIDLEPYGARHYVMSIGSAPAAEMRS
jgi:hypothetical protein